MPLMPLDDPQDRKTSKPSHIWLMLKCGHQKMVLETEKYPPGSAAMCWACTPPAWSKVVWRREIGEAQSHGGKK